jgi:hypothetical protein
MAIGALLPAISPPRPLQGGSNASIILDDDEVKLVCLPQVFVAQCLNRSSCSAGRGGGRVNKAWRRTARELEVLKNRNNFGFVLPKQLRSN